MSDKDHASRKLSLEDIHSKLKSLSSNLEGRGHPARPVASQDVSGTKSTDSAAELLDGIHAKLKNVSSYLRGRIQPDEVPVAAGVPAVTARAPSVARSVPDVTPFTDVTHHFREPVKRVEILPEKVSVRPVDAREITTPFLPGLSGRPGRGLDLGTSHIVAAMDVDGKFVLTKSERNTFLALLPDKSTNGLLDKFDMNCVFLNGKSCILGDEAFDLANILSRDVQRPMKNGMLNPAEPEAVPILKMFIQNMLGEPRTQWEPCCFSIPAPPVDSHNDFIHHRHVVENILKGLGFAPFCDDGYAVVFSELKRYDFTGIGVSCGAGVVNVCAAFKSMPAMSFSISRGGDWIDEKVASVLGINATLVSSIKEKGMSLDQPVGREEEAIAIYYRHFIKYICENIVKAFTTRPDAPRYEKPVDVVFTGGSTLVGGFMDIVRQELENMHLGFPLRSIERSEEPFASVPKGCFLSAVSSHE